jgi:hypothetical protein
VAPGTCSPLGLIPSTDTSPALKGIGCAPSNACRYTYTATCSGGAWQMPTYSQDGCIANCRCDTAWQGTGCSRTLRVCGQGC